MSLKIKMRIKRLEKSLMRDNLGNLILCYWNDMIMDEINTLSTKIK